MIKGTATVSLSDLRELLTDPDTRRNERQLHFRAVLNGRTLREFRTLACYPHHMMSVDFTWLIMELRDHPNPQDLRIEVTPET